MKVRKLDDKHDWVFGRSRVDYHNKSEAIAQCVKTKLLSLKNDWFLGREDGIAWVDFLAKNPDISRLESEVKRVVSNVEGVEVITFFNVTLDTEKRIIQIQISYDDIFNNSNEVIANVTNN